MNSLLQDLLLQLIVSKRANITKHSDTEPHQFQNYHYKADPRIHKVSKTLKSDSYDSNMGELIDIDQSKNTDECIDFSMHCN